jgi:hypothetical protein
MKASRESRSLSAENNTLRFMRTKLLLTAVLIGAASLSARAGVAIGFSFGVPLPAPVVVAPAPVVVAPPVVVTTPAYVAPAPVWVPGYWSVGVGGRIWVPGYWHHGPVHYGYARPHGYYRW